MAKPRKSIKLTNGQKNQISNALDLVATVYSPLGAIWPELTPAQRRDVLAHAPLLQRLINLAQPFGGGNG